MIESLSRRDYADIHLSVTGFFFVIQGVFSFCYLGAQITAKAAEVNESIYCSEWYTYPPTIQMFIVYIMRRSQKPFILTGYSLVSCSLQSFKDMLNFVASVFVLLLKVSK
ncbi:odorant receptor 2a-like [Sitodiplosis mosellana]|uniref:odorant receptor 2a-like n=1 Tax=Sitodiplosis mosellana TaxID=263140 RepID=UPI00244471C2|nr:odorant receptor 2a-like [Sitodiplosis mosellana]